MLSGYAANKLSSAVAFIQVRENLSRHSAGCEWTLRDDKVVEFDVGQGSL